MVLDNDLDDAKIQLIDAEVEALSSSIQTIDDPADFVCYVGMIKVLWTQRTALVQAMGKRNLEHTPHKTTTTHTDPQDAPFAPDISLTWYRND